MDLFQQYAYRVAQIKKLTDANEKDKPRIMGYIKRGGGESIKKPFGTFTIVDSIQYEYSTQVKELEAALSKVKKQERETGIAKPIANPFLRFNNK